MTDFAHCGSKDSLSMKPVNCIQRFLLCSDTNSIAVDQSTAFLMRNKDLRGFINSLLGHIRAGRGFRSGFCHLEDQ